MSASDIAQAERTASKRASYKRRIQALLKRHSLPHMPAHKMLLLLDRCMSVTGDALTDPDLRTLAKLTLRGLLE